MLNRQSITSSTGRLPAAPPIASCAPAPAGMTAPAPGERAGAPQLVEVAAGRATQARLAQSYTAGATSTAQREQASGTAAAVVALDSIPQAHIDALLRNDFSRKQISKIAEYSCGSDVIAWLAVGDNLDKLRRGDKGFNLKQISMIAANSGALHVLEWLVSGSNLETLGKKGFDLKQIGKIANKSGASAVMIWLVKDLNLEMLVKKGFNPEQIARIAATVGANGVLAWLNDGKHVDRLLAKGFKVGQITSIASNIGAKGVLEGLHDDIYVSPLLKKGFMLKHIARIASTHGARGPLNWLIAGTNLQMLTLEGKGFDIEQVTRIASANGAKGVLEWLIAGTHLQMLTREGKGFDIEQVASIASADGASGVLAWLAEDRNLSTLTQPALGFTLGQIARIGAYAGALKTLMMVAMHGWDNVLSAQEVVALVSTSSGSGHLAWVLENQAALPPKGDAERVTFLNHARSPHPGSKARALTIASASTSRKRASGVPAAPDQPAKRTRRSGEGAIKREPSPISTGHLAPPLEAMEIDPVNTAQARYVPTTTYHVFDLSGESEQVVALTVRHPEQAMLVGGGQTYDARCDRVFPIRDPGHPHLVHPAYADASNPQLCADNVRVVSARFTRRYQDIIWSAELAGGRSGAGQRDKQVALEHLSNSCLAEMRSTLRGDAPPSCGKVEIVTMTESHCDSPEEAAALEGQYGGVLRDAAEPGQHDLRNVGILGLFAGAKLVSQDDIEAYRNCLGAELADKVLASYGFEHRGQGQQQTVTWAPYGGGNMMQYLNAPFKMTLDGKMVVDTDKVNAKFVPVHFSLTDSTGTERTETLLAVVQIRPISAGQQIRLDYGPAYRLDPAPAVPMDQRAPTIKQEQEA